jgi:prepilin-type N-terminal cleavage/methylation domain-containing protein
VRETSANSFGKRRPPFSKAKALGKGYTLFEILIALALVAILISAALPYLFDSRSGSEGDRAAEAISDHVAEVRKKALESGEPQELRLAAGGLDGLPLPGSWTLEIRRMNDSRFRKPSRDESWIINGAGICEPLTIRISGNGKTITLPFDALTGQVLPDHE